MTMGRCRCGGASPDVLPSPLVKAWGTGRQPGTRSAGSRDSITRVIARSSWEDGLQQCDTQLSANVSLEFSGALPPPPPPPRAAT